MRISSKGLDLIKEFEGLRLSSYRCASGVLTIGWGHTGNDVYEGQTITEAEAETLLKNDLRKFEDTVNARVTVKINQNEFDALTSFTFNVGGGAFSDSTLLRYLNEGRQKVEVADQFLRWVKGAIFREAEASSLGTKHSRETGHVAKETAS